MTLTVEDGTNVDGADALISVEFFEAYHESIGSCTDCAEYEVEEAIRKATMYLSTSWTWAGTPVYGRDQSLPFPMSGLVDRYGNEIDSSSVPIEVQQATAVLALIVKDDASILTPQSSTSLSGVKVSRLQADTVSEEIEYFSDQGGTASVPVFRRVSDLLLGLGAPIDKAGGMSALGVSALDRL